MNESLCKIISTLNSIEVRECLESLGYTYNIAPLKYYNNILRNKYTLDYNIKVFNANKAQINTLALAIIKKAFNDDYIRLLINNNICMLSYSYNKVATSNTNLSDIRTVLTKYLGKVKYSYVLKESILRLVVDVPANKDVSKWKPVIKEREASIIIDLMTINININTIETIFSFNGEELDDIGNALLEIGFSIE